MYNCKICNQPFETMFLLCNHVRWEHKKDKKQLWTCYICGNVFIDKAAYIIHSRKHSNHNNKEEFFDSELVSSYLSSGLLLCQYGCETPAKYIIGKKKLCCSQTTSGCPELIRKNKESHKNWNPSLCWKNGHPRGHLGKPAWNKDLTKDSNEIVRDSCSKAANTLREKFKSGWKPIISEETEKLRRLKLSLHSGGYRIGSRGHARRGWYKGYWCDSSWELAWIIYSLEHGIKFEKNTQKFSYIFNGKNHTYLPDFYLIDLDSFVEVKAYITEDTQTKLNSVNKPIQLVGKNEIQPCIDYTISKYGKNFISLYDH